MHSPPMCRLAAVLALVTAATVPLPTVGSAQDFTNDLFMAARDSTRAASAIARIDSILAATPDSALRATVRSIRITGLLTLHAPADEIAAWTDSALASYDAGSYARPFLYERSAEELIWRGALLGHARRYVEAGLAQVERDPQMKELRGGLLGCRARIQSAAGASDSALSTAREALAATREDHFPVRHSLLWLLADLESDAGRTAEAVNAHLAVAGAAYEPDTARLADLRRLWALQHGSPDSLAAALAAERAASRHRMTFVAPRVDRALPRFEFPMLEGPPFKAAALRGHVAVIDFWGTWCGPCREALPKLQALYERLGPRGVRFLTVSVEMEPKDLEAQRELVRGFMRERRYTLPVALDLRGAVTEGLYVPAFPTTWVVDRSGRVRFEDAGYFEGGEQVLADQVESLLRTGPPARAQGR